MTNRRINIDFTEYSTVDEMEPQDRELVAAANAARARRAAATSSRSWGSISSGVEYSV